MSAPALASLAATHLAFTPRAARARPARASSRVMGQEPFSAHRGKAMGVARAAAVTTTTTTTTTATDAEPTAVALASGGTAAAAATPPRPPPPAFPAPLTTARVAAATGTTVAALTAAAAGAGSSAGGGGGPPRAAYQGVPGAYSEAAAAAAAPGADPLPCAQFEVAFQALSQWLADTAVLPIENSAGGSVHAVYDLLLRYASLHLTGEVALAVSHCLLAPRGTALADVHTVTSHPQALAQCDGYLRRLGAAGGGAGRAITREAADDTAGAARDLARSPRPGVAAIASERAAELYGLDVLDAGIQDAAVNVTRFLVLGREPARPSPAAGGGGGGGGGAPPPPDALQPAKTSVAFSLPDGPGQLFKALSVFALRGIDLTKIESRPARDAPLLASDGSSRRFNYLFYVDVLAHAADPAAANALRHLGELAPYLRVLGCYPAATGPPLPTTTATAPDGGPPRSALLSRPAVPVDSTQDEARASLPTLPAPEVSPPVAGGDGGASTSRPSRAAASPRVAYQGVPGAYSEAAALAAFPAGSPVPCAQFDVAFQALATGLADAAVLPIENSLGGSIHAVYDLLLAHRLHVVGEVALPVSHCLLGVKGSTLAGLRTVASHYQALAQCDGYLRGLGPGVTPVVADDTAGAAAAVAAAGDPTAGALASARAAELYGLDVLGAGVQDSKDNVTRFLVLGRDPAVSSPGDARRFRTSLVCALPDGPGALFKALSAFALRDIDLSKVESRPLTPDAAAAAGVALGGGEDGGGGGSPFRYLFYFDVLANLASPPAQNALRHLQEVAPFMRVLGSYPIDEGTV